MVRPSPPLLTVTRSSSSGVSTVNWATVAGTALLAAISTPPPGTLTFNNGDTSKTITISIAADKKSEPTETFTVVSARRLARRSLPAAPAL